VRARRADAELLVLLAAQALLRDAPGGSELRIAIGKPEDRHVSVSIERSAAPAGGAPRPASPWDALVDAAARALAASTGAAWSADPAGGRARIRFACA
jgi:hypothetical protein